MFTAKENSDKSKAAVRIEKKIIRIIELRQDFIDTTESYTLEKLQVNIRVYMYTFRI